MQRYSQLLGAMDMPETGRIGNDRIGDKGPIRRRVSAALGSAVAWLDT